MRKSRLTPNLLSLLTILTVLTAASGLAFAQTNSNGQCNNRCNNQCNNQRNDNCDNRPFRPFWSQNSGQTESYTGNQGAGNSAPHFSDEVAPASDTLPQRRANTFHTETAPATDTGNTQVVPATDSRNPWDSEDLILGPPYVVAQPGAEVFVTTGVRDRAGYLRTNQQIRWSISPDSVGHFMNIAPREARNIFVGDFINPKIESDTQAIASTRRSEQTLDRGTPDPSDDIHVRRGETWISVSSPREGITWVTATAPKMSDAKNRSKTMKIAWVDAEYRLPQVRCLDFGSRYTMVTTLRKRSDTTPLVGWRVRYEITGTTNAVLANGAQVMEVLTDTAGDAKLEISQKVARQEETLVNIQIIRPAENGTAFTQPVVIQQSQIRYGWRPNTLSLNKQMASDHAYIGSTITASVSVQNLTNEPLHQVRVVDLEQDGLKLVGSIPEGKKSADGTEWTFEKLDAHEMQVIQLNYKIERPGSYTACTRAYLQKTAGDLVLEACGCVSAGSPTSPYTPKEEPAEGNNGKTDSGPEKSAASVTPSTAPNVQDPFATGTPSSALPPPADAGLSKTDTSSTQSPSRAIVKPADDPNALVGLDIVVNAEIRRGERFSAIFEIVNRSGAVMTGYDIEVDNSDGLINSNEGNTHPMHYLLNDIKPGSRKRLRGYFTADKVGEQGISLKVTGEGHSYQRQVKVRIVESGAASSAGGTPAGTPTPASSANPSGTAPATSQPTSPATSNPAATTPTVPTNGSQATPQPTSAQISTPQAKADTPSTATAASQTDLPAGLPDLPDVKLDEPAQTELPAISGTSTDAKPAETKPVEPKPTEPKPTETKPAESVPTAETKPADAKPEPPAPPALPAPEEVPANPVNAGSPPPISAVLENANSGRFSIVLTEEPAEIKNGANFQYTLTVTNTTANEAKTVSVLFALPTDMLEIQKDDMQGPTKCTVKAAEGVAEFAPVPSIKAGETVIYKVTAKTLKAGVAEATVRVIEAGQSPVEKTKETKISP